MQLSRRWQPIWPSLPLDLDLHDDNKPGIPSDGRYISRILSSHGAGAGIRRFRTTTLVDETNAGWLQTLTHRRIEDSLVLIIPLSGPRLLLSLDLLAGWGLRHLELHGCRLVDPHPRAPLALNHLHTLMLVDIKISETSLHRMIAGCPALRKLHLLSVRDLRRLAPRSRMLEFVDLGCLHVPLDKVSFKDAPNVSNMRLGYVDVWRLYPKIIAEAALPSTLLLALPMLDSPGFTVMPRAAIPIVTILVLNMTFSDCDELSKAAGVLSLFPRIQKLRIWCLGGFGSENKQPDALGSWQPAAAAATAICLRKNLEHVRLLGYSGTRGEMQFARFLMAEAKALTAMEIIHATIWSNQRISNDTDFICSRGKASSKAELKFEKREDMVQKCRKKVLEVLQADFI